MCYARPARLLMLSYNGSFRQLRHVGANTLKDDFRGLELVSRRLGLVARLNDFPCEADAVHYSRSCSCVCTKQTK